MKSGKWFELERASPENDNRLYDWPEKTRQLWKARLKERLGLGIRKYFKRIDRDLKRIEPLPAIFVFFPADCEMTGHLASIRKVWENVRLLSYECLRDHKSSRMPRTYFGTGMAVVWTRHVLRKVAELSPVFAPIWEDLKDLPPAGCGLYLADAPDSAWLASIKADEPRRFAEFGEARNLDKLGLDLKKPADEVIEQHMHASFLLAAGEYAEGERLLEDMLARWPGNAWRAYWDLASSALMQENPQRAYAVVRQMQKQYPDCLNFDRLGADCAVKLEDWARAEWHLKRLWGLNPWDPNLMLRYAQVAFKQGDYRLAADLYRDCQESGPLEFGAKTDYGVALCKLKRSWEALAVFRELEKQKPKDATNLNNLGFMLASAGRPIEALHYCRRAVELEPGRASAWDSLGFTHFKLGNPSEAAKAFLKAIDLNPDFPDAWRHLLHAYHHPEAAERLAGAKAYVGRILPDQLARFEKEQGTEISD